MADRKNNETTSWNADEVRRQQAQRKQRKKMRRTRFWAIYCAGVVLASCLLAGLGWLIVNDVCALNKAPLTATVEIEKGDSVGQIASKLKKAGIIKYKLLFVITSPLFHAKDTIQPGSYELNTDMDYNCIIDSMQQGSSVAGTVKVTIPEGYSVQETIQLLADSDVSNVEDLTEAAKNHVFDYTFVDNENLGSITRLEGFLFPDTYEFLKDDTVHHYVATFYAHFDKQITDAMYKQLDEQGMTLPELITLASFVQEEAGNDQDDNVAQVFRNRLAEGSPYPKLQSNASSHVQSDADNNYLWNWVAPYYGGWDNIPANIRDAYDTYNCTGLPAGPISNPGLAAIRAALDPQCDPEVKDCYFFVTDQSGHYYYAKTYAEHQKNCAEADSVNKSLK